MNRKKRVKHKGPHSSSTRLTAGSVIPKTSASEDCGDTGTENNEVQGSATSTHAGNVLAAKDRELAAVAIKLMVSRIRRDGGFIELSKEAEALTEGMMAGRSTVNSARLARVSVGIAVAMDKLLAVINAGSYNAVLLSLMFDGSVTLHEARLINKGLRERGLLPRLQ
uniref:Uncharacterized protein n=1 Tax=Parascaris univalens TaxID=6257 RepID=A0A914ZEN3_PARUN